MKQKFIIKYETLVNNFSILKKLLIDSDIDYYILSERKTLFNKFKIWFWCLLNGCSPIYIYTFYFKRGKERLSKCLCDVQKEVNEKIIFITDSENDFDNLRYTKNIQVTHLNVFVRYLNDLSTQNIKPFT